MRNETARREIESLDYYLQNHTNDYSEESHTAMMMAIKALEQEPRWIPVSERLPKESGYYLVCHDYNEIDMMWFHHEDNNGIEEGEWKDKFGSSVIAWMPLPKTYKPQESENKE